MIPEDLFNNNQFVRSFISLIRPTSLIIDPNQLITEQSVIRGYLMENRVGLKLLGNLSIQIRRDLVLSEKLRLQDSRSS